MVAWLGFLGKEDPVAFGASLQADKENESGGHACPAPEYSWAREIKNVGDWTGDGWERARQLREENPWLFALLSKSASAEQDAEPLQIKAARAEAEAQESHNEAAQPQAHL